MFINPIDRDKVAENPGLLAYPHHLGSIPVRPEDVGKLKSRALASMLEQTNRQLLQLQRQAELLAQQAYEIKNRVAVSEKIYTATMSFEPFVGNEYYLYEQDGIYKLMMIAPFEWGKLKKANLNFVNTVKLLSDHTWEIIA